MVQYACMKSAMGPLPSQPEPSCCLYHKLVFTPERSDGTTVGCAVLHHALTLERVFSLYPLDLDAQLHHVHGLRLLGVGAAVAPHQLQLGVQQDGRHLHPAWCVSPRPTTNRQPLTALPPSLAHISSRLLHPACIACVASAVSRFFGWRCGCVVVGEAWG